MHFSGQNVKKVRNRRQRVSGVEILPPSVMWLTAYRTYNVGSLSLANVSDNVFFYQLCMENLVTYSKGNNLITNMPESFFLDFFRQLEDFCMSCLLIFFEDYFSETGIDIIAIFQ
jgi:hypothetical protein